VRAVSDSTHYPSRLAQYLDNLISGNDSQLSKDESQMAKMQELVAKYSDFAQVPAQKGRASDKRTVVCPVS
jgi:hypothetical protein